MAPAPLLAANHPRAGGWLRFPGQKVATEALKTFLFMESSPLVGQYDWRALERASAANLPAVTVFAAVGELHHTYHDEATTEQEGGTGGGDQSAQKGWTFDSLSTVLRPVGLSYRHDINLLIADKWSHSYDMHPYNLHLPEHDLRTVSCSHFFQLLALQCAFSSEVEQ